MPNRADMNFHSLKQIAVLLLFVKIEQVHAGKINVCAKSAEDTWVGIPNANVVCWDEDSWSNDDWMTSGETDANGCVTLTYDTKKNKRWWHCNAWDDCRGNPDIYCEVSGSCLQPTVTQVKWNQNQDTIADFGTVYVEANSNFCHDSTWNGCGPTYIPDFLTDIASDVTNFRNSCNQHDVCYQNCSVSREQCEIDFILNMYAECQGYYLCLFLANLFYAAVFHGGEPHCIENRTDLSCTPAEISSCGI